MGLLNRLLGRKGGEMQSLYQAVVARAREPHWYLEGGVPDTVDGRFDMIAAVLSMVLLRLETDPAAAGPAAHLAERFVDDMDAQLRQIGIGDIVVGKHIGRMMAALGGRLGAYRSALAGGDERAFRDALVRNLYRGEVPSGAAVTHVASDLVALRSRLSSTSMTRILAGELP